MDESLRIYYEKPIGKGSFSKVFLGKYKNKLIAVKIIFTSDLDDRVVKQLRRELEIIKILQKNPHPNIVTYYKIIEEDKRLIILMEFCRGGELKKAIEKKIPLETVKDYYKQMIEGYQHLLKLSIVHRDIKDSNLLLTGDASRIKFADFGLSKIISCDLSQTICGSPLYMAPELLYHQDYDTKSDIWSLGILLYAMVYGYTPFQDCNDMRALRTSVGKQILYSSKARLGDKEDLPVPLINYLKSLLESDPVKRINWENIHKCEWLNDSNLNDNNNNNNNNNDSNNDMKFNDTDDDYISVGKSNLYTSEISSPEEIRHNDVVIINHTASAPIPINIKSSQDNNNNNGRNIVVESFGTINTASLESTVKLSLLESYFSNESKDKIFDSDFIDITTLDNSDILLNLPPKRKNKSIYHSSTSMGKYIYSKSAPVVTNIAEEIGSTISSGISFGLSTVSKSLEKIEKIINN